MSDSDSDDEVYQQQADEDWEEWDGDEEEDDATKSLFSDTVLPSPEAAFAYDGQHYGFDIRQFRIERQLDDYEIIKAINYIRREVAAGRDPLPALAVAPKANTSSSPAPWSSDDYLNPVLPDDPLITYDYDEGEAAITSAAAAAGSSRPSHQGPIISASASSPSVSDLHHQLSHLAVENRELKLRVAALMDAALPQDVRQELLSDRRSTTTATHGTAAEAGPSSSAGTSATAAAAAPPPPPAVVASTTSSSSSVTCVSVQPALKRGIDQQYFDSYSGFDIHQEMLSDKPRTESYQSALTLNPDLIRGSRVLDVGCGTAILSLFAAKGGAAAVVGLDGSQRIAECARKVVCANGVDAGSGGPVNIISGQVEQLEDIGHEQVDVIVSEWMGYALLFESMLDSVITARDRWLKPGGAVLPDIATIFVAGASREALGTAFWKDVYGFNMAPIADELTAAAAREGKVLVRAVDSSSITTDSVAVHRMDLATMQPSQQDFTAQFELTAASSSSSGEVAALVLWFDTEFSERFCREHPVTLSTSPSAPLTHWAQAVLPLQQPVTLVTGSDEKSNKLVCRLSMARSRSRHRSLDISLEYCCCDAAAAAGANGANGSGQGPRITRIYTLEVSAADSS